METPPFPLHRRLGYMADAMVSAKVGPQARFFSRERVDEIVLLLREAEHALLDALQEQRVRSVAGDPGRRQDNRQGCDCRCCDHGEGSDCACECHASGRCAFQSAATGQAVPIGKLVEEMRAIAAGPCSEQNPGLAASIAGWADRLEAFRVRREPREPDVVPLDDPNVPESLVPIPKTGQAVPASLDLETCVRCDGEDGNREQHGDFGFRDHAHVSVADAFDRLILDYESMLGDGLTESNIPSVLRDARAALRRLEALRSAPGADEGTEVLQAVLDAIAGTLDPSTQIADHPNVKFAQMQRLKLLEAAPGAGHAAPEDTR
jgi:hypothetical protein